MKRISPSKSLVLSVAFVAAALACTPAFAAKKSKVAEEDDGMSLLEMSDEFDQLDKQDFQAAIERATSCTRMRDFPCAESELSKAAKVANDGKDKKILLASRQSLADERQELANEIRRAEEARRREEEERQARIRREEEADRERERRARESEDDQSVSEYYAAIGEQIRQRGAEDAALLDRVNRQTVVAYAETNRKLAEQAAERRRAREEQEEHAAERRRDAERDRARAQRVAEARERDEADARERREREGRIARADAERQQDRGGNTESGGSRQGCSYYLNENAGDEAGRKAAAASNARLRALNIPACAVRASSGPSSNTSK